MPTLNAEKFLHDSIRSVLAQSMKTWELLIIDGGSSDATLSIANTYAENESRIRVITLPSSSIYEAITKGFEQATGDIFAWLNADDLYTPWTFTSVNMWMSRKDVDWITGRPAIFDDAGIMRCIYPHIAASRFMIRKGLCHSRGLGCIQAESTFFKAALYEALSNEQISKIQSMKLAGDFILWRYLSELAPLHKVPTVLGGFRLHCHNRSTKEGNTYQSEVRDSGAWHFPAIIARVCQFLLGSLSGVNSYKSSIQENSNLNQSIARSHDEDGLL